MAGSKKEGSKRTLVRWSDDLDKQLLLSIQYACNEAGLRIPWDNVAKLMGEKFSDGAIVQHMSKLRQKMVENNLPVPPPLKRGVTVVPSKIYATSGTARRKSMPATPTNASIATVTPKSKPSASKKRNRRSRSDIDSDSPVEDMDIADSSDDEYGTSARKRKRQPRQAKVTQASKKKAIQEPMEMDEDNTERLKGEDVVAKSQTAEDDSITASVETPGPAARTRGVRPDYSRLDQASDDEDDANAGEVKHDDDRANDEGEEEEQGNELAVVEDHVQGPKIESDGDMSPRSKVSACPATPAHSTNLSAFHGSPHSGNSAEIYTPYLGTRHQYQSPQDAFPGVPPTSYLPRSNITSFSTNRNESASSLASSMPRAFGSQSSIGQASMDQISFPSHDNYLNHSGLDFSHLGGAFGQNMRQSGVFRSDEDDHEEFGHLFTHNPGF